MINVKLNGSEQKFNRERIRKKNNQEGRDRLSLSKLKDRN